MRQIIHLQLNGIRDVRNGLRLPVPHLPPSSIDGRSPRRIGADLGNDDRQCRCRPSSHIAANLRDQRLKCRLIRRCTRRTGRIGIVRALKPVNGLIIALGVGNSGFQFAVCHRVGIGRPVVWRTADKLRAGFCSKHRHARHPGVFPHPVDRVHHAADTVVNRVVLNRGNVHRRPAGWVRRPVCRKCSTCRACVAGRTTPQGKVCAVTDEGGADGIAGAVLPSILKIQDAALLPIRRKCA